MKNLSVFFNALFEPGDFVSLSLLPVKNTKGKAREKTIPARQLKELCTKEFFTDIKNESCFACFTPNPLKEDKPRSAANVETLNCIFIDVDDAKLSGPFEKADFIFSRDDTHHHLYFLLERLPATDKNKKRVQELSKKLIHLLGGDKAVHDPARVLRIPYAPHVKKGVESQGYKLRQANFTSRHTVEEIEKLVSPKEETSAEPSPETEVTEIPEQGRINYLKNLYLRKAVMHAGEGRSRALFFIGLDCHGWGIDEAKAVELAAELNEKLCNPPEDDATVTHQIESAYKYRKAPFGDFAAVVSATPDAKARNKELKKFEELERVRGKLTDFVYITGAELLIDRKRRLQYSTEKQINNFIAHRCATFLSLSFLLKEAAIFVVDKIDFRPSVTADIFEENGASFYNRYRPHVLPEPTKNKAPVKLFTEHLKFLTTNETEFQTLLNFLAFIVQNPGKKIIWAPLIVSQSHGVGKSILEILFKSIFSPAYVTAVDGYEIMQPQTDFLEDKIIVIGEEIELGEKNAMARLRNLISREGYRKIAKYARTVDMTNPVNFLFFSNRIDAIRIDKFDRRLFVIFNRATPKPAAYYKALAKAFTDGAPEIYDYLNKVEMSNFNPNERPGMTDGKKLLIEQSRSELDIFLAEEMQNKSGEFENEIVSVKKILSNVKHTAPDSAGRYATQKSVQFFLYQNGYTPFEYHVTEEGERVHRRGWFIGSKAEFDKAKTRMEKKELAGAKS